MLITNVKFIKFIATSNIAGERNVMTVITTELELLNGGDAVDKRVGKS